jgi:hypothetical protein
MMMPDCGPNYARSIGRRIMLQAGLGKSKTLPEK